MAHFWCLLVFSLNFLAPSPTFSSHVTWHSTPNSKFSSFSINVTATSLQSLQTLTPPLHTDSSWSAGNKNSFHCLTLYKLGKSLYVAAGTTRADDVQELMSKNHKGGGGGGGGGVGGRELMYVLVSELIIMQWDGENRGPAHRPKLIKPAGGCSLETAANVNTERLRSAVQFIRLVDREREKKKPHHLLRRASGSNYLSVWCIWPIFCLSSRPSLCALLAVDDNTMETRWGHWKRKKLKKTWGGTPKNPKPQENFGN